MQKVAFRNGQFVDAGDLVISPTDAGFLLGVTIAEQIRTFNGRPFWLSQHLQRLFLGLRLAGIESPVGIAALHDAVMKVVATNHSLHARRQLDDIGVTVFVTPGPYPAYATESTGPIVAVHTYPLQFPLWAERYQSGQRAVVSSYREIPTDCWPAAIKCRSRMHYFLASQAAKGQEPGAIPILLDHDGFVSETPIASLLIYSKKDGFATPRSAKVLPGISMAYVKQWAARSQVSFRHADLTPGDLMGADEVILASTPYCALPLVAIDSQPVGCGTPGEIYSTLMESWSNDVAVDIQGQAAAFEPSCRYSSP